MFKQKVSSYCFQSGPHLKGSSLVMGLVGFDLDEIDATLFMVDS